MMPATRQPAALRTAAMSAHTTACTAGSRTIPFLMVARAASNCGLISATKGARAAFAQHLGKAAGRSADIEANAAGHVDPEVIKRCRKLNPAARDVRVRSL